MQHLRDDRAQPHAVDPHGDRREGGREGDWTRVAESGSLRALRLGGALVRGLGRGPLQRLLWLPAAYYLVRSGPARRASRQYLHQLWSSPEGRAALGRPPGTRDVLRHLHEFAISLSDRVRVWSGSLDALEVDHDGSGEAFDLARDGRGALLLGAHVGSLDMLGFLSRKYDLVVNIVAFFDNAQRVNDFLRSLSPEGRLRAIELDPASVRAAFEIRACIERGELVAMLADRLPPGGSSRVAVAPFLGRPARFPLGPFRLASLLGCPVRFALCVRTGDGRYRTVLRPLAEAERVRPREREKRAREILAAYVALLESFCASHPHQWFNFYDFWAGAEGAGGERT